MVIPLCVKQGVPGPLCVEGSGHGRNTGITTADTYWALCALNTYKIGTVFISILKRRKLKPERRESPSMSQPMASGTGWRFQIQANQLQVYARVALWGILSSGGHCPGLQSLLLPQRGPATCWHPPCLSPQQIEFPVHSGERTVWITSPGNNLHPEQLSATGPHLGVSLLYIGKVTILIQKANWSPNLTPYLFIYWLYWGHLKEGWLQRGLWSSILRLDSWQQFSFSQGLCLVGVGATSVPGTSHTAFPVVPLEHCICKVRDTFQPWERFASTRSCS